jgi:hypothetical protein
VALLWRQCAIVLLFAFLWDIGFDLLAPLHADSEAPLAPVSIAEVPDSGTHPDCGLPDHHCALSHHHHFPALVSTTQSIILPAVTEQLAGNLPVTAHHRASTTRLIRGPPSSFNPLIVS